MTWRAAAYAFGAYAALAVVITFPLVLNLSAALPHDLGDPLLSTSILWWNAHTLPFSERWWNGFAFFPAPGMLAFSDHRLGASLIASPIQWLGGSDITAYNLTLLLTFPLSALAAHFLGWTLTKRHDAAAICGLAYGFNPYRIAHVEHLELLAAYGMPLALAALHRFAECRRAKWIALFAVALIVQGLSTSYFLLFFCVMLALWLPWFVRWRDWRFLAAAALGGLCAAAVLSPIIVGYLRIHHGYAMTRGFREVLAFSADVSSFAAASPLLSLWGWTSALAASERQLFPGLAVTAIALGGAVLAVWRPRNRPAGSAAPSVLFAALGCAALLAAASVRIAGTWQIGPLRVSEDVFKPQSVALVFIVLSVAALPATRRAFGRKSPLAFYLFASGFLFLCSLGPKPTFLGTQVLYEPPYAWLMRLPVFGSAVRVPARFAMPAVLALATASAIGFARLTRGRPRVRRWAFACAACGIVADTWTGGLPMVAMRSTWSPERAAGVSSVLELPLGMIESDVAAMHRATRHGRPTMNGYSGFSPPHYAVLRRALGEGDRTVLDEVAAQGPVLVALDRRADRDLRLRALVEAVPGATNEGFEGRWAFFRLPGGGNRYDARSGMDTTAPANCGQANTVTGITGPEGVSDIRTLFDGDPMSGWTSRDPQRAGDLLVVTAAGARPTCSVSLSLGAVPELYPGSVAIELSLDGLQWDTVFTGETGGRAMAAALRDPEHSPLVFRWSGTPAKFIRIRLLTSHPIYPWAINEIVVRSTS
ncbi:MAG: hypothetical protein GEU82_04840 [Luteitalea sp.]|nr:hypothetical protein [Luteitalea sp.]